MLTNNFGADNPSDFPHAEPVKINPAFWRGFSFCGGDSELSASSVSRRSGACRRRGETSSKAALYSPPQCGLESFPLGWGAAREFPRNREESHIFCQRICR